MAQPARMTPEQIAVMFPNASKSLVQLNTPSDCDLPRSVIAAAGAAPKPKIGRQPNQTEREYGLMLKAEYPEAVIRYEAYTLCLAPALRYTPDYSVRHPNGDLDFHECKGKFIFARALNKPKIAAQMFGEHRFFLAQKKSDGAWEVNQIPRNQTPQA